MDEDKNTDRLLRTYRQSKCISWVVIIFIILVLLVLSIVFTIFSAP